MPSQDAFPRDDYISVDLIMRQQQINPQIFVSWNNIGLLLARITCWTLVTLGLCLSQTLKVHHFMMGPFPRESLEEEEIEENVHWLFSAFIASIGQSESHDRA